MRRLKFNIFKYNSLIFQNLTKFQSNLSQGFIQTYISRKIIYNSNSSLRHSFSTLSNSNEHNLIRSDDHTKTVLKQGISEISTDLVEPEEYKTIYIENLPQEWTEDEIRVRLEQIGPVSKLHIIRDSVGISQGKILAIYQKVEHVMQAIEIFKDKMPLDKPVKIRFFRESLKPKKEQSNINISSVLIVKNLPDDLRKEDLKLFISEFKQPVHISYPRDHEDQFKKMAFIYFLTNDDAEYVLKYANLRYIKNKQLYFQYSFNHFDITDFRTRIELGIKLEPSIELKMYDKQIAEYKKFLEIKQKNKKSITRQDYAKLEYLTMRKRKFEYSLRIVGTSTKINMLEDSPSLKTDRSIEGTKRNTKKFLKNSDKVDFNKDKSIVFLNSHKYIKKN